MIRLILTCIVLGIIWYITDWAIWLLNQPSNIGVISGLIVASIAILILLDSIRWIWGGTNETDEDDDVDSTDDVA